VFLERDYSKRGSAGVRMGARRSWGFGVHDVEI